MGWTDGTEGMSMLKRVFVGTFELGYARIKLYLRPGTGADFDYLTPDGGLPAIQIGADATHWRRIVGALIHETQEISMQDMGLSFQPCPSLSDGSANYTFVMNHEQFNECCCRSGDFVSSALPALLKAWEKWNKVKK
jgi:hypothetical protein